MLISDLHDLAEAVKWCDTCREHQPGHCDGCHKPWVASEVRYRSQSYHFHPAAIAGIAGTRSVQKELCIDCYRLDHKNVYPDAEIPDLPDRGMDPNYHAAMRTERKRARIGELKAKALIGPLTEEELAEMNSVLEVGLRFQ